MRELDGAVIALLHERARGKASGVEVDIRPAFVCRFSGEKIIWARAYLDRAQALADAEHSGA